MFTDKTDFNNILDKAATVWVFFSKFTHKTHKSGRSSKIYN